MTNAIIFQEISSNYELMVTLLHPTVSYITFNIKDDP